MAEPDLSAVFEFFADNPPTILIAGGILGWILCGFTKIDVFCAYWFWLIILGVILQFLYLWTKK